MTHPEYIIHLSVYIDEKFGEPVFHLNIRHWSEGQYTVILDCNVTSFNEELKTVGSAQIHEILDDVAVKVDIDGSPLIIQTQSSHGYMVSLPEIGNIVVSNDGNLAIEGNHNIESLKIAVIAPYQVILFRAVVNQMDISSQGVILFKESIVEMDSLQIVPVDNNKGSITCFLMTEGSEFKAHELLLNNSIVYSLGTMNVENVYCRGSSILNFGSFTTKLLDNVTYLFNGKESSIKEVQKIVSSYVINHGLINFQNLEIFTSADIKNFGVLDGKSNLYMNCLCNNINEGMFRSKNQIVFDGNQLELSKGSSIVTNTFQFLCKSTTISTNIEGVNVKMLNLVQANSFNIFKNVEIYGVFINYGALYVDNNISLLGKKASIMNAGNIEVSNEILSLALEGEICDYIGERYEKVNKYIKNPNHPDEWRIHINCKGIRVKSSLNINATFHTVHNIEVYESSKLYIFKTSIIQGLKSIVNRGEASMFSSSPTLESFINEPQAKLILESKTYYGEIHGELELEGEVHIGDYFPNINSMTIKEGAKVYLNKGNEFPSLSTLTNHGEALVSPSRIFNSLKSVINYGNIFVKVIHKEIDESVISIKENGPHIICHKNFTIEMEESSKMKIGKLELYGNLITKGSLDIDVSSIGNFPNLSGNIQAKTLILEFGKNSNYLIDEKFPNIEHCDSVEIYSDNIFLQNCKLLSKILFFSNNLNTEGTNLITNLEIHSHDFVLNGIIKIGKSFVFDGKSILSNSGIAQIFGDAKIKAESLRLGSTDLIPLQEGKAILDKDVSQIYTSFMALGKMNLECKDIWLNNAVLYGRQQLNVFNENLIENKTGFIASDGSIYIKSSKLINGESDNTAFPHYSLHRGTIVTPESIKDGHSLG